MVSPVAYIPSVDVNIQTSIDPLRLLHDGAAWPELFDAQSSVLQCDGRVCVCAMA